MDKKQHFPLYLTSSGKKVIVIGGGVIATRRVKTLAKFDFDIEVVSLTATDEIIEMASNNAITFRQKAYNDSDIESQFMVLACTDKREINKAVGERAEAIGAYYSVCDDRKQGNFFFPSVIENNDITVSLVGDGNSHKAVKACADNIRAMLNK